MLTNVFYSTARATIDLRDQSPGKATLLKITGNTVILSMVSIYPQFAKYFLTPKFFRRVAQ